MTKSLKANIQEIFKELDQQLQVYEQWGVDPSPGDIAEMNRLREEALEKIRELVRDKTSWERVKEVGPPGAVNGGRCGRDAHARR